MAITLKLTDGKDFTLPEDKKAAAKIVADAVSNRGYIASEDKHLDFDDFIKHLRPGMKDAVSASDIRPFMQTSMEIVLREPVEPLMVISSLFDKVMSKGLDVKVIGGALGAVVAADIPENGTYPEVFFQLGGGYKTVHIGKSGLACSFTDEALRYSTWDIMAMNLKLMRNALIRHKEQKAIAFLRQLGTVLFDNATPSASIFGVTTGRGMDMAANGTFTMDDLQKAIAHMTEQGFAPTILLCHPNLYLQFIQDPVLRNLWALGAGGSFFGSYTGNPGPTVQWPNMGGMGMSNGNTVVPYGAANGETPTGFDERAHGMNSAPVLPTYGGWGLRVISSVEIPYDETSGLTDIYLIKAGEVGFLLQDEELVQVEWRDENVEVVKCKLRERYGFGLKNEGQGVGLLKNIRVGRNYWDGIMRTVSSEPVEEIDPVTAVV